jgi:phosphate transport system substrate-binding protein
MNILTLRSGLVKSALICAIAVAAPALQAQTVVRLHGAVTLEKLFNAQKQAIESQTGTKLEVVGNGSGRGLADLCGGLADVAMLGGSLKGVAEASNKEKPGSVDIANLHETPVSSIKIAIVVHPSVGVKSLTEAQLRDVFSGKAKSWKDVGGADAPVKMVVPFLGDGARISLQESIMKDTEFAKDAILRNSAKDLAVVVNQVPGACSFMTLKNAEDAKMAIVAVDRDLQMPTALVTKGEPSAEVKKVVELAKTLIK